MTAVIIMIALGYFVIKLQYLHSGSDKTINYNLLDGQYGAEKGMNMSKAGQIIAVSVIGASDGQTKYDSKYVRMIAEYFYQDKQGEFVYENVPLNSCTEA